MPEPHEFLGHPLEAADIESQIPNLKFSLSQQTADPALIKLERARTRGTGEGANLFKRQQADATEAIREYYKRNFPDEPGIDDLISNLERQKADLEAGVQRQVTVSDEYVEGMQPTAPQATGERLVPAIERQKEPVKSAMDALEEQIPDYPMAFNNIEKEIDSTLKNPKMSAGTKKAVESFNTKYKETKRQ